MAPIARLEFYFPEPGTNRSDDRDGRPYHDFGLPVLGVRPKRKSRLRRVEVCFNLWGNLRDILKYPTR